MDALGTRVGIELLNNWVTTRKARVKFSAVANMMIIQCLGLHYWFATHPREIFSHHIIAFMCYQGVEHNLIPSATFLANGRGHTISYYASSHVCSKLHLKGKWLQNKNNHHHLEFFMRCEREVRARAAREKNLVKFYFPLKNKKGT